MQYPFFSFEKVFEFIHQHKQEKDFHCERHDSIANVVINVVIVIIIDPSILVVDVTPSIVC